MSRALVLGFYGRENAGDEMYKIAIPVAFQPFRPQVSFTFLSIDDMHTIPTNTYECIIFGGGDIINPYFMDKASRLLATYTGRVYAFSVGIPYKEDSHYLRMFDHVFVRSSVDYAVAVAEVGSENVTRIPDAVFALQQDKTNGAATPVRLGLCLAQPYFYDNPNRPLLVSQLSAAVAAIHQACSNIEVHLIPFNYHEVSESESDLFINEEVYKRLAIDVPGLVAQSHTNLRDPMLVFEKIQEMHIVCGMRFHSIVFGVVCKKHVVPLYCTPKVASFVHDFKSCLFPGVEMQTDAHGKPTHIDSSALAACIQRCIEKQRRSYHLAPFAGWNAAFHTMFLDKKLASIMTRPAPTISLPVCMESCKRMVAAYIGVSGEAYDVMLHKIGPMDVRGRSYMEVAKLVCLGVTQSVGSPYIWGLHENMQKDGFVLDAAIRFIHGDFYKQTPSNSTPTIYYPQLDRSMARAALVHIDPLFVTSDLKLKRYHRSGWPYVLGGLMNLDAGSIGRSSEAPTLMLDTYVDRTFHWALEVMRSIGKVPYTRPWVGIVHHTFDTTHSTYNCAVLFQNAEFLQSLSCCRGLVALTGYLSSQLRSALDAAGFPSIPVTAIYHPMPPVLEKHMFTMQKYARNAQRYLVQIGTWLRNPYGIYNLSLPPSLGLQKAALRARDSGQYFAPKPETHFFENLEKFLFSYDTVKGPYGISGHEVNDTTNMINKYNRGMYQQIEQNHNSVVVLEHLTDDAYDELLSENVVYLKLVDCSAVNTVLECIVRNTPIVINRHPALEEVLGPNYPGFYTDDLEAVACLSRIEAMHNHLRMLDKTKTNLATFLTHFQEFVMRA